MVRSRERVGQEQRDCPTCLQSTTFTLFESFNRRWFGGKQDARRSAVCDNCGYRTLDRQRVIQFPT